MKGGLRHSIAILDRLGEVDVVLIDGLHSAVEAEVYHQSLIDLGGRLAVVEGIPMDLWS